MPTITQSDNPNNSVTEPGLLMDEFLPIIKWRKPTEDEFKKGSVFLDSLDEKVTLDAYLDNNIIDLWGIKTEEKTLKIHFTIKKGSEDSSDDDGIIKVQLSNLKDEELTPEEQKGIKIKSEQEFTAAYKSEYTLELEFIAEKSKEFYVDFFAKDDENDRWSKGELKNVHCGRVKVVFFKKDKDIFDNKEVKRLMAENKKAQIFNKTGAVLGNGYCINTADRSLGALLNDTENFYTEPNLIAKGGNGIRLESSTIRAKVIESHGYIANYREIRTNNYNTSNAPTALATSLKSSIEKDIDGRKGFHVYYFSMHGEYHVMLLLINFENENNPTFSILDQGYIDRGRTRNLDFNKIDDFFLQLEKGLWNNKKQHAKNILLWKIKRN